MVPLPCLLHIYLVIYSVLRITVNQCIPNVLHNLYPTIKAFQLGVVSSRITKWLDGDENDSGCVCKSEQRKHFGVATSSCR